tara:strand:+ start:3252 stop:3845 length:594 start_codon:yes stop_codon:yes gene_type:complete
MVYNFPQTNIRLCLKIKNIPEYLIDIIVNNYNNSYYIHKVLDDSKTYHIKRLEYQKKNINLNLQIQLFIPGFLRYYNENDYEHNGETYLVINQITPENINNLKIRTSNLLMNWTKDEKELDKIENDGNIYICAHKNYGDWFTTILQQHRTLCDSLDMFQAIANNYLMFGNNHLYQLNPCVKCILYENNIVNITIKIH